MTGSPNPDGPTVGKVSIKVVPDTHLFRDELKAQLESMDDIEYEFDAKGNVDRAQLAREVRAAARDARASVDIDTNFKRSALDEIQQYTKKLNEAGKDLDLIKGATKGLVAQVGLEVDPKDRGRWRAEINEELASLRDLTFSLTPTLNEQATRDLLSRVRALKLRVDVDVDRNALSRALGSISRAASGLSRGLGKGLVAAGDGFVSVAQGAAKAGQSILRMGDAFWILAGVVAVAAPALALLSGALVALPGLLAAVAVPAGVVALGMDGIKKAAEAAAPAFNNLKTAVSGAFETGLTPAFTKIGEFAPKIQGQLTGLATTLSTAFSGVVDTLTSGAGLESVRGIINNISESVQRATPGMQAFTNALLNLTQGVTGTLLQDLADSFTRIGTEFDNWVSKVTANGQLQAAMGTLRDTLGEIGGTIKDIASYSFDALADPAFGDKMRQFAADLRTIVNELLPLLKSGFEDVATIINGVVGAVEKLKGAASWIEKITGAKPGKQDGPPETAGFMGLGGKDGLLGAKSNVGQWWSVLFGGKSIAEAQAAAEAAGQSTGAALQTGLGNTVATGGDISKAINEQLASAVSASKEAQAAALKSVFQGDGVTSAVGTQLGTQMDSIFSQVTGKIGTLAPVLQAAIDNMTEPLNQIPAKLNTAFAGMGAAFAGAFIALQGIVTQNMTGIADSVALGFQSIPAKLTTAFAGLGAAVAGAMIAVKGVVTSNATGIADAFGQAFSGAAGTVSSALAGVPSAVAAALAPALGVVATTAAGMLQIMQAGLAAMVPVVEASFAAVPAVITAKMAEANAAVASGVAQMIQTALSMAGGMEAAGATIGASFARGIASSTGLVASAAAALMAAARAVIPSSPAKEGPFSGRGWVTYSGESVGKGFAQGMKDSTGGVVDTARELMQAVKDIFGSAEGLTLNFNMGAVTEQAQTATAAVKEFGTAVGTIPKEQLQALQPDVGGSGLSKDELSRQLSLLEQERKSIEIAKSRGEIDNAAAKARLKEIQDQKNILGLEKDKLIYAEKYGDAAGSSKTDDAYKELSKKAANMPVDFLKASGQQFMQDIGISGGGAMGALMDYGMQLGSSFVFNVSNVDEAMRVKQNETNKQGMGVVGR